MTRNQLILSVLVLGWANSAHATPTISNCNDISTSSLYPPSVSSEFPQVVDLITSQWGPVGSAFPGIGAGQDGGFVSSVVDYARAYDNASVGAFTDVYTGSLTSKARDDWQGRFQNFTAIQCANTFYQATSVSGATVPYGTTPPLSLASPVATVNSPIGYNVSPNYWVASFGMSTQCRNVRQSVPDFSTSPASASILFCQKDVNAIEQAAENMFTDATDGHGNIRRHLRKACYAGQMAMAYVNEVRRHSTLFQNSAFFGDQTFASQNAYSSAERYKRAQDGYMFYLTGRNSDGLPAAIATGQYTGIPASYRSAVLAFAPEFHGVCTMPLCRAKNLSSVPAIWVPSHAPAGQWECPANTTTTWD